MFRSESGITDGDIYYIRGTADKEGLEDIFENELVVHAPYEKPYWTQPQAYFYIGMSNKKETGNRWIRVHVDDVDDLVTALLYAKELSINPEIRPTRKEK